jgi:hypothetical protein
VKLWNDVWVYLARSGHDIEMTVSIACIKSWTTNFIPFEGASSVSKAYDSYAHTRIVEAGIAQLGEQQTEVNSRSSGGPVFNPRSWHCFFLMPFSRLEWPLYLS